LSRKIVLLNVVLAAVVIFACFQMRNQWRAAKSREAGTLHPAPVRASAAPTYYPLPAAEPVLAAGYNAVAQKDLFDPSRNPNVPVDAPPPPPPPPPMPVLPRYYGQMNLDGVSAILSETANTPQTSVKPGETIGQFKLVDVSIQEIVFEWNGQLVRKRLDELLNRNIQPSDAPAALAARQAPPPPAPVVKTPTGPGELTPQGFKVCNPNDSTADGTVVDGFRKVAYSTPFGSACRWDPVGK
jgi:hypothetical protein